MPTEPVRLIDYLDSTPPAEWTSGPCGWPGEIEAALIDSVMGIRATYGSPRTGVRAIVARWREREHRHPLDDLTRLAEMDAVDLADVLGNRQRLTGGALKTTGLVEAADRLIDVGVRHAADLDPDDASHCDAYQGVAGLGPVTWQYLALMLGVPGRESPWLAEVATTALGRRVGTIEALDVVEAASASIGADPTTLLRAMWTRRTG